MLLQTPRLLLRPWAQGDLELLLRLAGDPGAMRHIPNALPRGDASAAAVKLESLRAHWTAHGFGLWVVTERNTGAFIGRAGLQYLPGAEPPEIEVGYILLETAWGRGYATELAQASLWFAFERLNADHVVALALAANEGSTRVMLKAGMTREGTGVWYGTEMVRHAIARQDWTPPAMKPEILES